MSAAMTRALACCRVCNRFVLLHPHHRTVTGTRAQHLLQGRALSVTRRTYSSRVRCPKYRHIEHCPSLTVIMRIIVTIILSKPKKKLKKSPKLFLLNNFSLPQTPFTSEKPPKILKDCCSNFIPISQVFGNIRQQRTTW